MDRNDVIALMAVLKTAYPSYYKQVSRDEALAAINLWSEMFADDDPAIVSAATKALIASRTEGFPPTIGAVKAKMHDIANPDVMTEDEAWRIIAKALRNGGLYNSREEFDKLPAELRKIVHDPMQLKEWAMMDEETVQSVVASNFRRSYRVSVARKKELDMLPQDVRAAISSTVGRMRLE